MSASNCEPVARSSLIPESAAMAAAWSQQGGLSDARVARQQERFPSSLGDPADEQAQLLDLRFAADQFHWPGGRLIVACADPVHLPTLLYLPEHVQPAHPSPGLSPGRGKSTKCSHKGRS